MGRPFLTHDEFVRRLELDGRGYKLRDGYRYEETRKKVPLICPNHPENDWWILPSNIFQGYGCRLCRDEKMSRDRSLNHEQVEKMFSEDSRGVKIREGSRYTTNKDKLHLVCPDHPDFDWHVRPLDVLYNKDKKCSVCVNQAPITHERLQKELEGRNIEVLPNARRDDGKMLFRCTKDNYEWWAHPTKVNKDGSGCPKCSKSIPWTNERVDNWLTKNSPTISRIGEIGTATRKTKFRCLVDGYEWDSQFGNILHGFGCPRCSDFKHWNDTLIDTWLLDNKKPFARVGAYKTGQRTKFKCLECDTEWMGRIGYLRKGYGCPTCTKGGGFDINSSGNVYYAKVKVDGELYYKIGITNRKTETRIRETSKEFEVVLDIRFKEGLDARNKEQKILSLHKEYLTDKVFSGSTECFTIDIRDIFDLESFLLQKEPE